MADTTTELEVLDQIVDVLGGQSGQYETVVPTLQQILALLGGEGIPNAVEAVLAAHPEWTTTVQDGSITGVKLADDTIPDAKLAQTGGVLDRVTALDGLMAQPAFEKGDIYYGSTWSYGASSSRVRVPQGQEFALRAGDIITLAESGYQMYIGWIKDGTNANGGTWVTTFVAPVDASYSMLVRKNPETSITVDEVKSVVRIYDGIKTLLGVSELLRSNNLFDIYNASAGHLNSDGTFSRTNAYNVMTSDHIAVTAGEKVLISISATAKQVSQGYGLWSRYAFYDANYDFVSAAAFNNVSVGYNTISKVVTVPSSAAFMRVSARIWDDGYMLVTRDTENALASRSMVLGQLTRLVVESEKPLAKLLLGSSGTGWIDLDTSAKTLTVPRDTILIRNDTKGLYKALNNSGPVAISYADQVSTALKFAYSPIANEFYVVSYETVLRHVYDVIIALVRHDANNPSVSCTAPWRINGVPYKMESYVMNYGVKAINHRGYNTVAPENTLPAYRLSKKMGFDYVECDVSMTSDRVPVLLHDETINRTARNADGTTISSTVNIGDITYAEALEYDFGIYKGDAYAGTPIPTFEQFIILCRNLGLQPYIELKGSSGYTAAEVQNLVDIVAANGMSGNVSWISFDAVLLGYIVDYDANARIGYVCDSVSNAVITTALALMTSTNEVFIDVSNYTNYQLCVDAAIPLEVWTANSVAAITSLPTYVTGVTSDNLIAGKVLYQANI